MDTDRRQEQSSQADPAQGTAVDASYQVAALSEDEVEKLRQLEEELREDTGEEVIVIAYEKDAAARG